MSHEAHKIQEGKICLQTYILRRGVRTDSPFLMPEEHGALLEKENVAVRDVVYANAAIPLQLFE